MNLEPNSDIHSRLCQLLEQEGASFRVVEHVPEGRTELIARIRGNRLEQAIKSIVVQVRLDKKQNQYCLANVPGDCRVDLEGIRGHFNASSVGIAAREKAESLTGCEIGAIPPFSFNEQLFALASAHDTMVYTIAYGSDADEEELSILAAQTNGKFYEGTTANIDEIYNDMSASFGGSAGIGR